MNCKLVPLAAVCVAISVPGAHADPLDVHSLNYLLSSEGDLFAAGAPPDLVEGMTWERVVEIGAAALLTQESPQQLLFAIDAERLCRIDGNPEVLSGINGVESEALIERLRSVDRQGRCNGSVMEAEDRSFHLFISGVGDSTSEALWLSASGVTPVRSLPSGAPLPPVAEALFAIDPKPDVVLTFGAKRLAFERDGSVFVVALGDDEANVTLLICPPDSDLPFWEQTPFIRYGSAQDAAYQAAMYTDDDNLDPLAYVVCQ